jgi:hypothetical protein
MMEPDEVELEAMLRFKIGIKAERGRNGKRAIYLSSMLGVLTSATHPLKPEGLPA